MSDKKTKPGENQSPSPEGERSKPVIADKTVIKSLALGGLTRGERLVR